MTREQQIELFMKLDKRVLCELLVDALGEDTDIPVSPIPTVPSEPVKIPSVMYGVTYTPYANKLEQHINESNNNANKKI